VAVAWLFSGAVSGMISFISGMKGNETIHKLGGPVFLFFAAIISLAALIFFIGILVNFTFLQKINGWIEQQVLGLIPGYDFFKSMMEEKLHVKSSTGKPVLVQMSVSKQLGIQIEEHANDSCTVYFPHSVLTGGGEVHVVSKNQVTVLDMPLSELDEVFNRFGKGLGNYYKG
ncbi:MAG: DUF502 domain-containing protein, partial [Bacteroidota bacterium]